MRPSTTALVVPFAFFMALPWTARADVPLHPTRGTAPGTSVHAEAWAEHRGDAPLALPSDEARPLFGERAKQEIASTQKTVYGYWPYWGDSLSTLPYDSLTHLALFAVDVQADGSLTSTSYWTNYVATARGYAEPYGVKIHLCVVNFDANDLTTLLSSSSYRSRAVSELASLVNNYGGDGVNVDFEGLPSSQKANFVSFIQALKAAVPEVYIATPAIDWSGAYDYDVLAANSDGLFIMGYNYHWSSGDPGPVAPLFGGSPWSAYSLEWTVDDYVTWGTPLNKIVLGLPLYGYDWPTTSTTVPGDATGSGSAILYSSAVAKGLQYGRHWDSVTHTPYTFPDSVSQLWYDDLESVEDKAGWGFDQELQGVGLWALTYEDSDPTFWAMMDELSGASASCEDVDADLDGYDSCTDCNDHNAAVSPGSPENPSDGVDNDCDGTVDESSGGCDSQSPAGVLTPALSMGLLFLGTRRRRSRQSRC